MTPLNSPLRFLRSFLQRCVDALEKAEPPSSRLTPRSWYQIEYHFHPVVVALTSLLLLFGVLCWGVTLSLPQAIAYGAFSILLVVLFAYYHINDHPSLAKNDDAMALLAVVFMATLILIKIVAFYSKRFSWLSPYLTPVAVAPLVATLLLHPRLGVVLAFVNAIVFGLINNFSLGLTLVAALGGVTMVAFVHSARTAHQVARACLLTGVAQTLMVVFVAVLQKWSLSAFYLASLSAFLSGVLSAFFSLGALPFLQSFFSRISNLRLLELADVNHPILKTMSMEAPGTYHHSLVVASLAVSRTTATACSCRARAGSYK